MTGPLDVGGGVVIPSADLTWRAVRSSGPGGQNVNKVATKVELRLDLPATRALPDDAKARLRRLAGARLLDARGWIVVTSQRTRDRERNLEDARNKLRELVARALVRPRIRRPTRPTAGSRERRLSEKQRRGVTKRARRGPGGDE